MPGRPNKQTGEVSSVYDELTRPMNHRERALLEEWAGPREPPVTLSGTLRWIGMWTCGMGLCGLAVAGLVAANVSPVVGFMVGAPLAVIGIICLFAIITLIVGHRHWSRHHHDFMRDTLPVIHEALADGSVNVKRVTASAVIDVIAFEDEGSGSIYDVGEGRILFLKGERYVPVEENMPWPNSEFEIVRTAHGGLWVGLFCSGEELFPLRAIETSECPDDVMWEEREELIDGEIEQFAESLRV